MFNIVLYQPEIPPNTGNIMRLTANTGCKLHLIEPLGFSLDDKHLRRAGLDYALPHPTKFYGSFEEYCEFNRLQSKSPKDPIDSNAAIDNTAKNKNSSSNANSSIIYLCSTKATRNYAEVSYKEGDSFVFGPETRGLPQEILEAYPEHQRIRIPMKAPSRSLNLANAVSIIIYEAWRQQGFS